MSIQKQKLEILPPREILKGLEDAFNLIPIVPRDCVKAINRLVYNLDKQQFQPETYKSIMFLILRAFTAKDNYLKCVLYALLEKLSEKTSDGILSVNSIVKDLDDKKSTHITRNLAMRALFSNLPSSMRYEFQKILQTALIDEKSRDNAVCIASEYFKDMKIDSKTFDRIDDYHLSFFNRLPINKYTSMIEIRRLAKNDSEIQKIGKYLNGTVDSITFFEAARVLTTIRQELAAPLVDKAVTGLRAYLKTGIIEQFASMKILSKLALTFPTKVARANQEIEDLVQISSKTISMLAILTLLKTGTDQTAKQLTSKLEPLMSTMSESYRIIAIDTIEKLSKNSKKDYISFLKSSLFDRGRGSIEFKRIILKKLEPLLDLDETKNVVLKFLSFYVEDPEYYQISMDVIGLMSRYITNPRDLVHFYNRIILDNSHVRNCAYQALFDLDERLGTGDSLKKVYDPETEKIRSFLCSNEHLKRGPFNLDELGDLKGDVLKYLAVAEPDVAEVQLDADAFIKECRPMLLTAKDADISITLVKKIYMDKIVFVFTFENNMSKVMVGPCLLSIDIGSNNISFDLSIKDFQDSNIVIKEVEVPKEKVESINGVFEYSISLEDDPDETETDSISLTPFDISIFDMIRPENVKKTPEYMKEIDLKFKLRSTEAISKIVGVCNMHLIAEKDSFILEGYYNKIPVVIQGSVRESKHSTVHMEIFCDDEDVINEITAFFD